MIRLPLLFSVWVTTTLAVPLTYNNNAWYSGLDPHLVGKRENFMVQGVTVDAVRDANGFTGAFQAILKFNYGGDAPSIGTLSTISPYSISSGGVVSTIHAADLFFKRNGVMQYGIPLLSHGGPGPVNGKSVGIGVFDSGDLYHISNGIQILTSTQFFTNGTNPAFFGSGRAVWLSANSLNPEALRSGTTQISFHGLCTDANDGCERAEYSVTVNMNGAAAEGSEWYGFLAGIADGSITPYFTGSTCGNDLIDGSIPEPKTLLLAAGGFCLIHFRLRRAN